MKFVCIALDAVHGCGKDYTIKKLSDYLKEEGFNPTIMSEMWSVERGFIKPRKVHGAKNNYEQEVWWYLNWAIRECYTQILFEQFQTYLFFKGLTDTIPLYQSTQYGYLFDDDIIKFSDNYVILHNRSFLSVYAYSNVLLGDKWFNDDLLKKLLDVRSKCPFPKMEVVLTCRPEVGLQRLTKRARPTGKEWNEYDMDYWMAVNDEMCKLARKYDAELYDISEEDSADWVVKDVFKKLILEID